MINRDDVQVKKIYHEMAFCTNMIKVTIGPECEHTLEQTFTHLFNQGYAAKTVFEALQAQACHENMVKVRISIKIYVAAFKQIETRLVVTFSASSAT